MTIDIRRHLEARRETVERHLRSALKDLEGCPDKLHEAVAYSLLAPGKRLRPLLAILAAEATGGTVQDALPAGCAVEMIHAYSLIHDDLPPMDDDDMRRGQPASHKKFGEALAILAGDALLTLAFQVLATQYQPGTAAACCRELAVYAGALGMVGGQVDDLTWDGRIDGKKVAPSLACLESVHVRKTGALFRASVRLGLLAAQGPKFEPAARECLDTYARCFGLAFQITDDLLDAEGDTAATGKHMGKDAARGKLTYPGLLGVAESRQRAQQLCQQAGEAVHMFEAGAEPLTALMRLVVQRDR